MSTTPLLIRALRREPVERTPIWLMRQAGRYLPEYQALRAKHDFLEMCRTPELACEVTLQPIRRFGMDGAILFSDILPVLDAMGVGLSFGEAGPVIENPVRSAADAGKLREVDPDRDLGFVAEAVRLLRAELPAEVALLGFAGAPFTLLTYLVGGRGERGQILARGLLLREPDLARDLLARLARAVTAQLAAQIRAGVQAIQLFDTWAGTLTPELWREFAAPAATAVMTGLADLGVPRVYFARGTAGLLGDLGAVGADGYGVDWLCDLPAARQALGPDVALQGNLDPAVLVSSRSVVQQEARRVLAAAGDAPGYVFNLGHGVVPETDPDLVQLLVDTVREPAG